MNDTVKSFSIVTVFSVVTRLLSFLFKIWMSRSLGAETVGLYQIALSVILLLFSLTAGAPTVLSRKVAECAARGDTARQNALTTASLLLGGGIAIALCAVFYACSRFLGGIFADERCIPIFLIMLPALVTSSLYAPLRSWFWGRKKFIVFSATELGDEIFKIGFSLLFAGGLVASLTGAKGVALALVLSDVLSVVVLAALFFRAGGRLSRPAGAKELLSATLPLSAVRILTSLSASLTALVIPKRLVSGGMTVELATAQYGRVAGMALPLIMAPVTVVAALSVVLIPDIAELASKKRYDDIKDKLRTSLLFAALVASAFFALYVPLGKELGSFFFGDAEAGSFVSVAAVLIFPLALNQVTTPVLNSLGMEKVTFLSCVAGLACTLPCIFFLPPVIGIYSVAVASGAAFTVTSLINCIALRKKLGAVGGTGKAAGVVFFSLPLALLGIFSERLLSPLAGGAATLALVALLVCGLFALFVWVFGIVDVKAFFAMALPSRADFSAILARRKKGAPSRECAPKKKRRRVVSSVC